MSDSPTVFTDLTTEVEIPPQGTLSRVLYKDDRIRVVIFAFDTDQELTEHTASVAAVVQVVKGRLHLTLGEETFETGPGSWVQMPPRLPHAVRALEPTIMLLTMVQGG